MSTDGLMNSTTMDVLQDLFVSIKTEVRFTEAAVTLRDESVLYFCHRVGERWAKAVGPEGKEVGCSHKLLDAMRMFRLNAKHLEIVLDDGSCWEWKPGSV